MILYKEKERRKDMQTWNGGIVERKRFIIDFVIASAIILMGVIAAVIF